jgi:hypothetical protein
MTNPGVCPFSPSDFYSALANPHAPREEVERHSHAKYLFGYLSDLRAESIVIEDPYTDADFLDDYTAHYARCFADYKRRCKRVHFFRRTFTDSEVRALLRRCLSKEEQQALQRDYLGFVVARPLPRTIVGRTILRTLDDEARRRFPATRTYRANFFGVELKVEGLAFQEQDSVLAACATVALWSAFHKTADLFEGTAVPTPAVITRSATQSVHYGRPIPQHGLRVEEMCAAIRSLGLDPEAVDLKRTSDVPLVSLIYGYLAMGLPPILIVEIPGLGWHAITLVGYSIQEKRQRAEEVPGNRQIIPMAGLRIDKLYGHDDQIGPYSRLAVLDPACCGAPAGALKSNWKDAHGQPFVYPVAVIVPVYNKIRLKFPEVQKWLMPLEAVLAAIRPPTLAAEWDVHLILSNDYKKQLQGDKIVSDDVKESMLLAQHPRFWWRAVLRVDGLDFCEFLFDATGIAQSVPVGTVVWKVESFALALGKILDDPATSANVARVLRSERFVRFLRKTIAQRGDPGAVLRDSAAGEF